MVLLDKFCPRPTLYRRWFRQEFPRLFDEFNLHHATADASHKFTVFGDSHLVTGTSGAGTRAFRNDEQRYVFTASQSLGYEVPKLKFFSHGEILLRVKIHQNLFRREGAVKIRLAIAKRFDRVADGKIGADAVHEGRFADGF